MDIQRAVADERGWAKRLKAWIPARAFRRLTITYNAIASWLPLRLTYWLGYRIRKGKVPYRFLAASDDVVQVGAARDVLDAGRSRAVHFALRVPHGRVLVVEPDPENCAALHRAIRKLNLAHVLIVEAAAWHEVHELELLASKAHPASNLLAGVKDVRARDTQARQYGLLQVQGRPLDDIVLERVTLRPRLISITTNGAELEILDGSRAVLERCEYVSLASTGPDLVQRMEDLGFRYIARDDRGYCFRRADRSTEA